MKTVWETVQPHEGDMLKDTLETHSKDGEPAKFPDRAELLRQTSAAHCVLPPAGCF